MKKTVFTISTILLILLAAGRASAQNWWASSFTANGPGEVIIEIVYFGSSPSQSDDIDSVFVKARICTNNPCTNELTRKVKTCNRSGTSQLDCDVTATWNFGTYKCPYCGHALWREYYTESYEQQSGLSEYEWEDYEHCQLHIGHIGGGGGGGGASP